MEVLNSIIKNQFLDTILGVTGKISPLRLTQSYFIKIDKEYLYNWFHNIKLNFIEYSDKDIIKLLQHDYAEPPKCIVCNKNAKVQSYGKTITFNYCSKECSLKCQSRSNKISKSKLNKTVDENIEINKKRSDTMNEKYGVSYNTQRPDVKIILSEKLSKSQICPETRAKLLDKDWLYKEYIVNKRTAVDIAEELDIYYGTVIEYCKNYGWEISKYSNYSLPQKQIFEFISSLYSGEILYDTWKVLDNLELDMYIPELKLAIEFNGIYWHSSDNHNDKNKHRHFIKTNRCEELGIQLLHIRSDQWEFNRDIVQSIIRNKLGFSERIYARKCKIVELDNQIANAFLEENHIQGIASSPIRYGLIHDKELVAVMTFSKSRFNKNYDWELVRYCNKLDTSVIGGFSRLLKYFGKNHIGSIISYCDRSRSYGNVYLKNGFSLINKKIIPSYSWTDKRRVYNRLQFTRKTIKKRLMFFDETKTVDENMFDNKYRIIYDSGQLAFIISH